MKNPFLSLWLSGANRMFSTARGHMMSQARRQQSMMLDAMLKPPGTSSAKKRSGSGTRRAKR